jgi:hypothetical protein
VTNQELNQVYWTLPECMQDALNLCIMYGHTATAARMLHQLNIVYAIAPPFDLSHAIDWAKWRRAIKRGNDTAGMQRRSGLDRRGL